jgi:nitrogen fixation/metabolism regulation signal transduction histidine kinase
MKSVRNWFRAHENRVLLSALLSGSAAVGFTFAILLMQDFSPKVRWTVGAVVLAVWAGFAFSARERVVSPLRTLANLLEAMREGDYSIRGRGAHEGDALGEVMVQVNAMGATLRAQRLGALEATALLRKVMEEIDVAVFTFDAGENLRFVNRAGERLLSANASQILGRSAAELSLDEFLHHEPSRIVTRTFPGGAGRWEIRRTGFRESGLPLTMLVVSDLTRALREEELQAWQRLVRVLGHELNNSLTPIKSIAGSLAQLLARQPRPDDWEDDMRDGLAVIASRSEALSRFIGAYSRLAKLPRPRLAPVEIHTLARRIAGLETRLSVKVEEGPRVTVMGDGDQLEQVLINLVRNAADASLETGGGVTIRWNLHDGQIVVTVLDEGLGLSNTSNLFVPFFTTKPGGSGIGLVLSRQIAESHGGSLELSNRQDARGCEARLSLPA